jgi:RHS repeat-associated protein
MKHSFQEGGGVRIGGVKPGFGKREPGFFVGREKDHHGGIVMRNQRAFSSCIWKAFFFFFVFSGFFVSSSTYALDPPPATKKAYYYYMPSSAWGTVNTSPKLLKVGDEFTISGSTSGGPDPIWWCGYGTWHAQGTNGVTVTIPSCFDLVDYSPKASGSVTVTVSSGAIQWGAVAGDPPPLGGSQWLGCTPKLSDTCYCCSSCSHGDTCGADCTTREMIPFRFQSFGFSVTLKAKSCSSSWQLVQATFYGNHPGISWSDYATDYYKLNGEYAVSLTATPGSVPADGKTAIDLAAVVTEKASGVPLPNESVSFSSGVGTLSAASVVTDSSGVAHVNLVSNGIPGVGTVFASAHGVSDYVPVEFTAVPIPPTVMQANLGDNKDIPYTNDPVHPGLGNYVYSKRLFGFPGKGIPLSFEVNYNSRDNDYEGPLGFGWTHTFNTVLSQSTSGTYDIAIKWGDGHSDFFKDDGSGNYGPVDCNTAVKLTKPDTDHFEATLHNGIKYRFDTDGRLLTITDLNGNQITLTHSSHLDQITDTVGRQIGFTYAGSRMSAITSPLKSGNTVSFGYDGDGNLTSMTDPRGKVWSFTYDSSHRLLTHTDANGNVFITNTYDSDGRVLSQKDAENHVTAYEYTLVPSGVQVKITPPSGNAVWQHYDKAYNITKVVDGEGKDASFYYDDRGRRLSQADKSNTGASQSFDEQNNPAALRDRTNVLNRISYNSLNRPTQVIDGNGKATSFEYDSRGNVTRTTNALGRQVNISYDSTGQIQTITDSRGKAWAFTYGGNGLLLTETDPLGNQTGYQYDAAGRLTGISLPSPGATIGMAYDENGNLLSRTDPLGNVSSFAYDDNGNLLTRTFESLNATHAYAYDKLNRVKKITDPEGGEESYAYDPDGNLSGVTDPDGVTVTFQYDKSNRRTAIVDSQGHTVHYDYDSNGNVTGIQDPLGNTSVYRYDAENRLLEVEDPAGGKRTFTYDNLGRMVADVDQMNRAKRFEYDVLGQRLRTIQPDSSSIGYAYDVNGNLLMLTDPLKRNWLFSYDGSNRLANSMDPNGSTESYQYDGVGRITKKTLRSGEEIASSYDPGGRVAAVTLPGAMTLNYSYDGAGNVTGITDASGTSSMTYDKLGRRMSITDRNGKVVSFTYTRAGRLASVTYPGGKAVSFAYDSAGRLSTVIDWAGNQTLYQYDGASRVTRVDLPNGTRKEQAYDANGRLTGLAHRKSDGTLLYQYSYVYNLAGQITQIDRTEDVTGLIDASKITRSYDPVNRILTSTEGGVTSTFTFDPDGNLISKVKGGKTFTYGYDALNRLVTVSDGATATAYTYDGYGSRLGKTYGGLQVNYLRDGRDIYCTYDGSGTVLSYNVHAGGLLYSLDGSGSLKVYHGDERGSVAAITDGSQNVIQSYLYDPHGRVLKAGSSLANEFQYVGTLGVLSDENGLYQMQARYYDPEARRFIHADPIGFGGGPNLYSYANCDPVNRIDPEGLTAEVFQAICFWVEEGYSAGLRDPAYLLPSENGVVVNGIKLTEEMIHDYLRAFYSYKEIFAMQARELSISAKQVGPAAMTGASAVIRWIGAGGIPQSTGSVVVEWMGAGGVPVQAAGSTTGTVTAAGGTLLGISTLAVTGIVAIEFALISIDPNVQTWWHGGYEEVIDPKVYHAFLKKKLELLKHPEYRDKLIAKKQKAGILATIPPDVEQRGRLVCQ